MPAAQPLLFPDPKPLVERLGADFFKSLPRCPGVYLMRDAEGTVLYVGKAKNLCKRLGSYRVANPDRMPRRHLRLVRLVAQIDLLPCADEATALGRESELLRTLRPRFNRAGTWRPPPRYFVWRCFGQQLHFEIVLAPPAEGRSHGPLGSVAVALRAVLTRLCWLSVHPNAGFAALPCGWFHGRFDAEAAVDCGPSIEAVSSQLQKLFAGEAPAFSEWVRTRLSAKLNAFETACLETDLELLTEIFTHTRTLYSEGTGEPSRS